MAAPLPGGGAIAPPPAQPSIPALQAGPPFGGGRGGLHPGIAALIDLYHRKKGDVAYASSGVPGAGGAAPLPGGLPGTQIKNPNGPGPIPIYPGLPAIQNKNYPGTGGDALGQYGHLWPYYIPGGGAGNPSLPRAQQINDAALSIGRGSAAQVYRGNATGADLTGYADYLRRLLQGGQ